MLLILLNRVNCPGFQVSLEKATQRDPISTFVVCRGRKKEHPQKMYERGSFASNGPNSNFQKNILGSGPFSYPI